MISNYEDLGLDEALVSFYNDIKDSIVTIETVLDECHGCSYHPVCGKVEYGQSINCSLTTRYATSFKIKSDISRNVSEVCKNVAHTSLVEHNIYDFNVTDGDCYFGVKLATPSNLTPIGIAIGIYAIVIASLYVLGLLWNTWKNSQVNTVPARTYQDASTVLNQSSASYVSARNFNTTNQSSSEYNPDEPLSAVNQLSLVDSAPDARIQARRRVHSLDALRGLTILLMILVNSGGGGYKYLEHAPWYGLTIADIVFPSFIFIMGFSIVLSIKTQLTLKKDYVLVTLNIIKRSFKLFIIGFMLNTHMSNMHEVRITGVLQRFSISYLVVALVHLGSIYRSNKYSPLTTSDQYHIQEYVIIFLPEFLIHVILMIIYLYITFGSHFLNGCNHEGYQGPGGWEDNGINFDCTGGAANNLDHFVFGSARIYRKTTSLSVYHHTKPHDPEGLLGYTTSILLTQIGLLCGRVLLKLQAHHKRITVWFVIAVVCSIIALGLLNTIPIVKNLWSLSYVLLSASITIVSLIIFYLAIDVLKIWPRGLPFNYPGTNSLLLYIGHQVLAPYFPFYYQVDETSHAWLLFRSLSTTTLWLFISAYLYYKKYFFTL